MTDLELTYTLFIVVIYCSYNAECIIWETGTQTNSKNLHSSIGMSDHFPTYLCCLLELFSMGWTVDLLYYHECHYLVTQEWQCFFTALKLQWVQNKRTSNTPFRFTFFFFRKANHQMFYYNFPIVLQIRSAIQNEQHNGRTDISNTQR